jgi:hypothetical protein
MFVGNDASSSLFGNATSKLLINGGLQNVGVPESISRQDGKVSMSEKHEEKSPKPV